MGTLTMAAVAERLAVHGARIEHVMPPDTILLCEVGSTAHAISAGADDLDLSGICVEGPASTLGLERHRTWIWRSAAARAGRHDAPSLPGDIDLTIYGLRHFARLALNGNPTVLMLLHHPTPVRADPLGDALRRLAPAFASLRVVRAFLGYAHSQLEWLEGRRGGGRESRTEGVAAPGFDTKRAAHVWRLAHQGLVFAREGRFPIPLPEPTAEAVRCLRAGGVDRAAALAECHRLCAELQKALRANPAGLPQLPDRAAVNRFLVAAHRTAWRGHPEVGLAEG